MSIFSLFLSFYIFAIPGGGVFEIVELRKDPGVKGKVHRTKPPTDLRTEIKRLNTIIF